MIKIEQYNTTENYNDKLCAGQDASSGETRLKFEFKQWPAKHRAARESINSRELVVNVPHSAFCWSECKRWNVISCAYPLLLHYNPMAPLSVCYSHTYWLWACCGVKRALVATFCPDASLFKQWMDRFLKETLKCWALKTTQNFFLISLLKPIVQTVI